MPRLYSLTTNSLLSPGLSKKKTEPLPFEYIKVGYPGITLNNRSAYSPELNLTAIAGRNFVATTLDGREITPRKVVGLENSLNAFYDITYGKNIGFLAVGLGGVMAFSSDGVNWVTRTSPVSTTLIGCTYANDIFVICGSSGNIWTSKDTVTWTKSDTGNTTSQIWSITWNGTRWYTSGELVLTSTSPTAASGTWTAGNSALTNCWKVIVPPGTNNFVAAGNQGKVVISGPDGSTWNTYNTDSSIAWTSMAHGSIAGPVVILVGTNLSTNKGVVGFCPSNGLSAPQGVSELSENSLNGVVFDSKNFIINGAYNECWVSSNHSSWTLNSAFFQQASTGLEINSIDYSPTSRFYIAVGRYSNSPTMGGNYRSSDGYTWTRTTGSTGVRNEVRWLPDGFFYVVSNGGFNLTRSSDGSNWNVLPVLGGSSQNLHSITYGNGWYVVVGASGKIFYSATPTVSASWKTASISSPSFGADLNSVVYNSRTEDWVTVGASGNILRSISGLKSKIEPDGTFGFPSGYGDLGRYVHTDGTTVAIGLPNWLLVNGKVYLHNASSGLNTNVIQNPAPADTNFGKAVSVSGSYVAIGVTSSTRKAYIYPVGGGGIHATLLAPTGATEYFGNKITIDGNYCVVADAGFSLGAPFFRRDGRIHIYRVSDGQLLYTINNPDPTTTSHDEFGHDIDLHGNNLIVGTYLGKNRGRAYIYNVTNGTLTFTVEKPDNTYGQFGMAVAINSTKFIVGDPFQYGIEFDATTANTGIAYVFNLSTGNLLYRINNPNNYGTTQYDGFGANVSASDTYISVGTYIEDSITGINNAGVVYIYDGSSNTGPRLVRSLQNPNYVNSTSNNDEFGAGLVQFSAPVSIGGSIVVIGARNEDGGVQNDGIVYLYDLSDGPTYWWGITSGTNDNLLSVDYSHDITDIRQSGYVAVGSNGRWVSLPADLTSWTTSTIQNLPTLREVRWDPNREKFLVVGDNQTIYESSVSGNLWTQVEITNKISLYSADSSLSAIAISADRNQYLVGGINDIVLTRKIHPEYEIGDFIQGGYYSGKIKVNNTSYALILSQKATGQSSGAITQTPAPNTTLNNGFQNTITLGSSSPAALFCSNLFINGYDDWYLPSKDELELLYRNFNNSTRRNVNRISSWYTRWPEGDIDTNNLNHGQNANSRPNGLANKDITYTSYDSFNVGLGFYRLYENQVPTINFVKKLGYPELNEGIWVVGGDGARLARTTDNGKTWTYINTPISPPPSLAVACGGDTTIIIGGFGKAIKGPRDGSSWTDISGSIASAVGSGRYLLDIAYGSGKFVIVIGEFGQRPIYSSDGITWTQSTTGPVQGQSIVWAGSAFYANGGNDSNLYRSLDGITWSVVGTLPALNGDFYADEFHEGVTNKLIYSLSIDSQIYTVSTSTLSFTAVTLPIPFYYGTIFWSRGRWWGIGSTQGEVPRLISSDQPNPLNTGDWYADLDFGTAISGQTVVSNNQSYGAAGSPAVYGQTAGELLVVALNATSAKVVHGSFKSNNSSLPPTEAFDDLYWSSTWSSGTNNGAHYIQFSDGAQFVTSSVTSQLAVRAVRRSLEFSGVLIKHPQVKWSSPGTLNYLTFRANPIYGTLPRSIARINKSTWLVLGDSSFNLAYTNDSGKTWKYSTVDKPVSVRDKIAYKPLGNYVTVGGNAEAAYSSDGITWTNIQPYMSTLLGGGYNFTGVAYGAGRFVATQNQGPNRPIYSSDGVTWTMSTTGTLGYPPVWTGSQFLYQEFNSNQIRSSFDGISWSAAYQTPGLATSGDLYSNGRGSILWVNGNTVYLRQDSSWSSGTVIGTNINVKTVFYAKLRWWFIGFNYQGPPVTPRAWWSVDGITWTEDTEFASAWGTTGVSDTIVGHGDDYQIMVYAAFSTIQYESSRLLIGR